MAKLNLATQLKQSIDNVNCFDRHPLQEAEKNDKLNYLKALSLMIYADQNRHEEETAYFGSLYRTLNPAEGSLEALLTFAENPDFADTQELITTLRKQDSYAISFLLDLVMLAAADATINGEEKALCAACRGFLGWDHNIYNRWYRCCETLATGEADAAFDASLSALPQLWTDHILQRRGLPRGTLDSEPKDWHKEALREQPATDPEPPQLELLLAEAAPDSMAIKLKTALEAVARLSSHPLEAAELEDKMNYLKALSLVMAADDQIVAAEQAYFGAVTRTLVGDDILPDLLDYAREPDLSEVAAMVSSLAKDEKYKSCLLLDAAMLANTDGVLQQDEEELIAQFRAIIDWDRQTFTATLRLAHNICKEPEGLNLNCLCSELPAEFSQHILEYRGLTTSPITNLAERLDFTFKPIRSMHCGQVLNGTEVCQQPVTVEQFYPYLQYLHMLFTLRAEEGILCYKPDMQLIALERNGLSLSDGALILSAESTDQPLQGFSPLAAAGYCRWLSMRNDGKYAIPHVKVNNVSAISNFTTSPRTLVRCGSEGLLFLPSLNPLAYMEREKPVDAQKICEDGFFFLVRSKEPEPSTEEQKSSNINILSFIDILKSMQEAHK